MMAEYPGETTDVAAEHPKTSSQLREELLRWCAEVEADRSVASGRRDKVPAGD